MKDVISASFISFMCRATVFEGPHVKDTRAPGSLCLWCFIRRDGRAPGF